MSKNVTGFRKQLTQPTVRMFLILLANHLNLTVLDMISMGIVRKIQCVAVHSGNTVSECTRATKTLVGLSHFSHFGLIQSVTAVNGTLISRQYIWFLVKYSSP